MLSARPSMLVQHAWQLDCCKTCDHNVDNYGHLQPDFSQQTVLGTREHSYSTHHVHDVR